MKKKPDEVNETDEEKNISLVANEVNQYDENEALASWKSGV